MKPFTWRRTETGWETEERVGDVPDVVITGPVYGLWHGRKRGDDTPFTFTNDGAGTQYFDRFRKEPQ